MGGRTTAAILTVASAFALGACDSSDPAQTAPADGAARGEVLGGTISDEMIPLDQLRSESPPLRPAATNAAAGSSAAAPAGEEADPAAADEAADAPAEPATDEE